MVKFLIWRIFYLKLTCFKSLWLAISMMIAVSFYIFEFGFVTGVFKHTKNEVLNKVMAYSLIPMGFCINGSRSMRDKSLEEGGVWRRWPWLRLLLVAELKMFITFTEIHLGLEKIPILSILLLQPYDIAVPNSPIH